MSQTTFRIALDAMGGDHAPAVVVDGAILAMRDLGVEVILVGQSKLIEAELAKHDTSGLHIPIVHAEDIVEMKEHASAALRQKPRSSIAVGINLVKEKKASAFVSAGNSGAAMAWALFGLGRIPGIERPAIGTIFPTNSGKCFILDIGANTDCKPDYLAQFAIMGNVYMERVFGVPNPRVGLLSNGEEETKGNQLVQAAFPLLKAAPLNFIGNVEGKDVPAGAADVVVCDGFTGNILLKLSEGIATSLFDTLKDELTSNPLNKLAAMALKPAFRRVKKRLDYAEYGGAPLLGVNGVVIIAHGRSNSLAIKNAIRVAKQAVEHKLVETIASGVADLAGAGGPS